MSADGQRELLERIGEADPELAARLVLMTLPAAAARIPEHAGLRPDASTGSAPTASRSRRGARARGSLAMAATAKPGSSPPRGRPTSA